MSFRLLAVILVIATAGVASASAQTGGNTLQFYVSATDASGRFVDDLQAVDVSMTENGIDQTIARLERVPVPIKLTIAIDNGIESERMLASMRTGLKGLIEALPQDMEVTIITTAPQPRMVVKPTTNRAELLRGITRFAPEVDRPRFSDAIVEFSQRLELESRDRDAPPYAPVMVMISTGAIEQRGYEARVVDRAVDFLARRRARVNVIMLTTHLFNAQDPSAVDNNLQGALAGPLTRLTNGRYEQLAAPSRLESLLPEWGHALASLHARQLRQYRITVERGHKGELLNPKFELTRPGMGGNITPDGILP
jgi:hypothetical protein